MPSPTTVRLLTGKYTFFFLAMWRLGRRQLETGQTQLGLKTQTECHLADALKRLLSRLHTLAMVVALPGGIDGSSNGLSAAEVPIPGAGRAGMAEWLEDYTAGVVGFL